MHDIIMTIADHTAGRPRPNKNKNNKMTSDMRSVPDLTRKLSYRKDDRAMRQMYGSPENFRESLTMPTATFPEIFNWLLFRFSL